VKSPAKKPATADNLPRRCPGGSWRDSSTTYMRAANPDDCTPSIRGGILGFRTAQHGCRQILKGGATL